MSHEADIPAEWGNEEETIIPAEQLKEFDEIVDRSFDVEREIKNITRDQIDPLKKELVDLNKKILATLKHHGKDNYRSRGGMVVKAEKFSVKFPNNVDNKLKLIDYMGSDAYTEMSSIQYQTFNGWYKQKLDAAVEEGNIEFTVPGVEEAKYVEYLQRRK